MLDLDDVVEAVGGFRDLTPRRFEHAQGVLGELVGSWLARGFDVVAHGPFFHRREDEALLHRVPDGIEARRVLLRCDRETAIRRVAGDPTRGLSREVDVLRRAHDRFERLLPDMPAAELIFDTTTIASDEVVAVLCEALCP